MLYLEQGGNNQIIAECYAAFTIIVDPKRLNYYQLAGNQNAYDLNIKNVVVYALGKQTYCKKKGFNLFEF